MSNGLFRACIATIWRMECAMHMYVIKARIFQWMGDKTSEFKSW